MTTETGTEFLTADEVAVINAARACLQKLTKRAEASSYAAARDLRAADSTFTSGADFLLPADFGRLTEACEAAEGALFHALNVASSHLRCPNSKAGLHTEDLT